MKTIGLHRVPWSRGRTLDLPEDAVLDAGRLHYAVEEGGFLLQPCILETHGDNPTGAMRRIALTWHDFIGLDQFEISCADDAVFYVAQRPPDQFHQEDGWPGGAHARLFVAQSGGTMKRRWLKTIFSSADACADGRLIGVGCVAGGSYLLYDIAGSSNGSRSIRTPGDASRRGRRAGGFATDERVWARIYI